MITQVTCTVWHIEMHMRTHEMAKISEHHMLYKYFYEQKQHIINTQN